MEKAVAHHISPEQRWILLYVQRAEIRSWHLARRSDKSLDDPARMFNSIVQGWTNYYGRFYRSELAWALGQCVSFTKPNTS